MARRGVLVLLGCAWTLTVAGAAPAGSGDPQATGRPIVVAQAQAPIVAQAAPAAPLRPRLISLDFKDADINNILRILAEFSGLSDLPAPEFARWLTVEGGVATVPGTSFFMYAAMKRRSVNGGSVGSM